MNINDNERHTKQSKTTFEVFCKFLGRVQESKESETRLWTIWCGDVSVFQDESKSGIKQKDRKSRSESKVYSYYIGIDVDSHLDCLDTYNYWS